MEQIRTIGADDVREVAAGIESDSKIVFKEVAAKGATTVANTGATEIATEGATISYLFRLFCLNSSTIAELLVQCASKSTLYPSFFISEQSSGNKTPCKHHSKNTESVPSRYGSGSLITPSVVALDEEVSLACCTALRSMICIGESQIRSVRDFKYSNDE